MPKQAPVSRGPAVSAAVEVAIFAVSDKRNSITVSLADVPFFTHEHSASIAADDEHRGTGCQRVASNLPLEDLTI